MQLRPFIVILALSASGLAADCVTGASPGTANGECVGFYLGGSCTGEIGSYKPTCAGNCFQYDSFNSLSVAGDGTFGTDCIAYSDDNCQTSMGNTGNVTVGPEQCFTYPGAKSMRCYYRCHH